MKWFQDHISKLDTVAVAHKYQCESAITGPTDKGDGGGRGWAGGRREL